MEYADRIGERTGEEWVPTPVSSTNRLSMATEVRGKPGRIDIIGLKLGKELRVVDDVKAFGKVEKAEKSKFLAVGGGKDVVGYGDKRGFCGVTGAETVLG